MNFVLSSRAFTLLSEMLVKIDQNAPDTIRRNVRLIQLGINRHKNYVCRCLEVVDQAIARTFSLPDIPVPHPHLEYGISRPWCLIACTFPARSWSITGETSERMCRYFLASARRLRLNSGVYSTCTGSAGSLGIDAIPQLRYRSRLTCHRFLPALTEAILGRL